MRYFVIERENDDSHPLLAVADGATDDMLHSRSLVDPAFVANLQLGAPVPPRFRMVDHHALPQPVISEKIKAALVPLPMRGVQMVKALVDTEAGVMDYWILHVPNRIACLDRNRSKLDIGKNGDIFDIQKLVLDEAKLEEIPLEERMIFVLAEYISVYLVEETVERAIMSVAPVGIKLYPTDIWHGAIGFD